MTNFWLAFFAVQFVGLLCSAGVELFQQGLTRIICNVFALILLEPGIILARAVINKFYWERLTTQELFRYASAGGFFINVFFAIWVRAFVRALRPQQNN